MPAAPTLESIIIEPTQPATTSIIWLHGLGADGHDFAGIVPQLGLPANHTVRFIFPHAPHRPVTINQGYVMRAWYDIVDTGFNRREDAQGIHESAAQISELIERELSQGINSNHIILAGFSQGGAIALHTALRYPQRLAGVIALSTYLPLSESLQSERSNINQGLPIFMAHGHDDDIIPLPLAEISQRQLSELGYVVDWHRYAMPHSVCAQEISDIGAWLKSRSHK